MMDTSQQGAVIHKVFETEYERKNMKRAVIITTGLITITLMMKI